MRSILPRPAKPDSPPSVVPMPGRSGKAEPIIWVSAIRILATAMVFVYHFDNRYGFPHYSLGSRGIVLLVFLSGFLAASRRENPHRWLQRRFSAILIPYWSVIGLVIIANEITHYRSASLADYVREFLGLALFNDPNIYTISYFITIILLLYLLAYVIKLLPTRVLKVLAVVGGYLLLCRGLGIAWDLVVGFCVGYAIGGQAVLYRLLVASAFRSDLAKRTNLLLFDVQNYAYSFFLLHSGVLVLTADFLKLGAAPAFTVTLLGTALLSVIHKRLSDPVLFRVNRYLSRIPAISGGTKIV